MHSCSNTLHKRHSNRHSELYYAKHKPNKNYFLTVSRKAIDYFSRINGFLMKFILLHEKRVKLHIFMTRCEVS